MASKKFNHSKINPSLERLDALVEEGYEYPEAIDKVVEEFELTEAEKDEVHSLYV